MKAAFIKETGPVENIHFGDFPRPEPTGAEVLVKVEAVAVNPIDTYVRSGMVKMNIPLPFIVGSDLAGVVEQVGPAVKRFKPGDRVWGTNQGLFGRQGSFAEYAAVDECWLYPTPPEVSSETAAAGALVGVTAHLGLVRDAKLQPGEILFVNGGTGGVGSTVVQMAKALGAKVITTAGSEEKVQACYELGADLAINYKHDDLPTRITEFAPQGVNVWWETLRVPYFDLTFSHLAMRGRMILMAGRDARPEFPVGPFYTRDCKLFGFAMFNAPPDEQRAAAEDINRWMVEGKLRPRIDRVLPLAETAHAHQLQHDSTVGGTGALAGKLVLKP